MVVGPSSVPSIQLYNELFLWGVSVSADDHLHISQMTFHGLFAGRDDRFETKQFASRVLSRMRFSHWKLSDGPSQKVEAQVTLVFPEGMGDLRLAGFEFQSHRAQPCF